MDEFAAMSGYREAFDYTQFAHDKQINVLVEEELQRLVADTFSTISEVLRQTYGPYGSTVMLYEGGQTTTTKDGYNVFSSLAFSHEWKRMVYQTIYKIINRVNNTVGDGTTSCILLAEQLFAEIKKAIQKTDDKRLLFEEITSLEKFLCKPIDRNEKTNETYISDLDIDRLRSLVAMAGNYDYNVTDILLKAMNPQVDENGKIVSIRNVIVESERNIYGADTTTFETDFLPGTYRIRVNMDLELGRLFVNKRKIKVALYDHTFGETDWNGLIGGEHYDPDEELLLIAPTYSKVFMDNTYSRYMFQRKRSNDPTIKLILCEIKGNTREEVADLAAILQITPVTLNTNLMVDHETFPVLDVLVHRGNAMCFFEEHVPETYIERIKGDMEKEVEMTMVQKKRYLDRINALSLNARDTLITVSATSSLEAQMITDKIQDCICVTNSAMTYGCVPNILQYAYRRTSDYTHECKKMNRVSPISSILVGMIHTSIVNMARRLWESKYDDYVAYSSDTTAILTDIYSNQDEPRSYDIVSESYVDAAKMPTSVQYDLEVLAAALSIVKYLLTARALVFANNGLFGSGGDGSRILKNDEM
jgi:hypothetical protein